MNKRAKRTFNKSVYLSTSLAFSLLLAQSGYAGIKGVRSTSGGGVSSNNSADVVVQTTKAEDVKGVVIEGAGSALCSPDPDKEKYFPLDFFKEISRDGSSLSIEPGPDNKIVVKIPVSIKSCGKFKPILFQDPASKNVTVMMQLENGKTTYSEYLKCLADDNVLKDGTINHDEIPASKYASYSYVFDYSFDKDKDIKKSVKLSYGHPRTFDSGKDSYPPSNGRDEQVKLPDSYCMDAEKIKPQITYLNEGQDVLIGKLKDACRSGDAQKIAEARRSIGNAEALKDIADKLRSELDAGYLAAIKTDKREGGLPKIYEDMARIEDRMNKEKDTMDEKTAKKLANQYADLTKDLNSKFYNPAIMHLDELMSQREKMNEDDPRMKGVDEEIKKINEDVGAFAVKSQTSASGLFTVMEKYAINDSAKQIQDVRYKSLYFGKVYAGPVDANRGKPLTFEQANQKQYAGLQSFDRVLNDWSDQYLVGQGNTFPIQRTEKERTASIDRMNKRWYDYQQNEMKNYNRFCAAGMTGSAQNPVQCAEFAKGIEKRRNAELKRRDQDLLYINGRNAKLARMGQNYNDYQRRKVAEETADNVDPFGSSLATLDDSSFIPYTGPQQSTAFDPNLYNMGVPNGMFVGGNNPGMYNPQMVNPQMQVQPGQYQMPVLPRM